MYRGDKLVEVTTFFLTVAAYILFLANFSDWGANEPRDQDVQTCAHIVGEEIKSEICSTSDYHLALCHTGIFIRYYFFLKITHLFKKNNMQSF